MFLKNNNEKKNNLYFLNTYFDNFIITIFLFIFF